MESTSGFIEVRVISCKSLRAFNFFQKLSVYAVVSITTDDDKKADRKQLQKTPTDREGDGNPEWNHPVRLEVSDELFRDCDKFFVQFELFHEGAMFGDKPIGEVLVPLADLIQESNYGVVRFVTYQVRTREGKPNGELNFSFKVNNVVKDDHQSLKMESPASLITGYPIFHHHHHHHSPEPEPEFQAQFSSSEVENRPPRIQYPVLDLDDMLVQGPLLHSSSSGYHDLNRIQETGHYPPQNAYYVQPPPLPYPPPPAAVEHGGPYYYHQPPPPPPESNTWGTTPSGNVHGYYTHSGSQLGAADGVPLETTWSNGWQGVGGNYHSSSRNGW